MGIKMWKRGRCGILDLERLSFVLNLFVKKWTTTSCVFGDFEVQFNGFIMSRRGMPWPGIWIEGLKHRPKEYDHS